MEAAFERAVSFLESGLRSVLEETDEPVQKGTSEIRLRAVREEGEKLFSAFETMAVPSQVTAALWKGAAVCLVTRLCAAFCKDSGNEALSAALLFAGRVGTLLPALPLLEETLEIIRGFAG